MTGATKGTLMLAALAAAGVACGPSFQAIYEGDQKFEHCYALEDNVGTPVAEKSTCWRNWLKNYTYGQTRDRVEYAALRQRALSQLPTDEAMMAAAPSQAGRSVATPAPTNAFEPPPKLASDGEDGGAGATAPMPSTTTTVTAAPSATPPPSSSVVFVAPKSGALGATVSSSSALPAADCQRDCDRTWQACKAGLKGNVDATCTKPYRGCMRTCFQ